MSELSADEKTINDVARRIYEDRHSGMKNVWGWDDNGLDDEHPNVREEYEGYAKSAIAALTSQYLTHSDHPVNRIKPCVLAFKD